MQIDISSIQVPPRHRQIIPEKVEQLAESMQEIGLMTPITCYDVDTFPYLIAGWHRPARQGCGRH